MWKQRFLCYFVVDMLCLATTQSSVVIGKLEMLHFIF